MHNYDELMNRCIELAKKGRGMVSPNPLVGCVVLNKYGNVISEGFHRKYGEAHAERDALLKITDGSQEGGTLIVNLEPCSHWGKTPPCADLIIERNIKKVVIGACDSNPKVNGEGIKKLKDAGIEVIVGIQENECRKLNEIFFKDVEKNSPFVAIKTATTIDGKIAASNGDSKWITSDIARNYAKELRGYYDAILTSSATVIKDNPNMEHRLKIILDRELKTDFSSNIYKTGKILLATVKTPKNLPDNVEIITPNIKDDKIDLNDLIKKLYNKKIKSIFVEAGGNLSGEFIKFDLADKIYQFIAPKILNDNSGKSCFSADTIIKISDSKTYRVDSSQIVGQDVLITYSKI